MSKQQTIASPLRAAVFKKTNDFPMETIYAFPQNKWVTPTNQNGNAFDVFSNLFEWGLVCRMDVPQQSGTKIYFLYNYEMDYRFLKP